jgi:hypothetical protein
VMMMNWAKSVHVDILDLLNYDGPWIFLVSEPVSSNFTPLCRNWASGQEHTHKDRRCRLGVSDDW